MRPTLALYLLLALAACAVPTPGAVTPKGKNAEIVKGPPMQDIVTDFDRALICMKGKFPKRLSFGVGTIADTTGKEQYADSGTGKLVSQGAGDMVQSALFRAGLTVVNRRDPNIPLAENNWGIRNIRTQIPADLFISGSINSLDFIPGGGAELSVAGVGPRYRQNRVLIGLDLALTDANTGRVVANVPLQKQLYEKEIGFETSRYLGETLVEADIGGMEREALQLTLRQMMSYAVFELLAQTLDADAAAACRAEIRSIDAAPSGMLSSGDGSTLREITAAADEAAAARKGPPAAAGAAPTGAGGGGPAPASAAPAPQPAPQKSAAASPPEARQLAGNATAYAARAIAAADRAARSKTAEEADKAAREAEMNMAMAVKTLKEAAAAGLTGPEGDAAATLVEQAIAVAQEARRLAKAKAAAAPTPESPGAPGPDDKKLGGTGMPTP